MTNAPTSRGTLWFAGGILAGVLSAFMHAWSSVPSTTAPAFLVHVVVAYLVGVPLYMAGLGGGVRAALTASAASTISLLALLPPAVAFVYALVFAVPATLLSALAMHARPSTGQKNWYPEGNLVTAMAIYPCGLFLIAVAATANHGGLIDVTSKWLTAAYKNSSDAAAIDRMNMIGHLAQILPAMLACGWILVTLFDAWIAGKIIRSGNWDIRPPLTLAGMRVPNGMIIAVALTGLAGVLAPMPYSYIGVNLCIVLCAPFFLLGLAIVHAYAASTKIRWPILIGFYVLVAWVLPLVAAIGVLDQWFDFRRRFAAGTR